MSVPPHKKAKRIKVTEQLKEKISSEIKRTGVGPSTLLKGQRTRKPQGLDSDVVRRWLNGQSKTADTEHIKFVTALWEALPDEADIYINLTPARRKRLHLKLKDTGLSPRKLFEGREDQPEGFAWQKVHTMVKAERLEKEHYEYLLHVFKDKKNHSYREITDKIRNKISSEIERTGISIYELIRRDAAKKKPEVYADMVYRWLNGEATIAKKEAIDYILKLYRKWPDKRKIVKHKYKRLSDFEDETPRPVTYRDIRIASLEPISVKQMERLQYYRDRYSLLPTKIFKVVQEAPPAGLNESIISSWLHGSAKKADAEYMQWVLEQCRAFEKFDVI